MSEIRPKSGQIRPEWISKVSRISEVLQSLDFKINNYFRPKSGQIRTCFELGAVWPDFPADGSSVASTQPWFSGSSAPRFF